MPRAGLESMTPAFGRAKAVHALGTVIGHNAVLNLKETRLRQRMQIFFACAQVYWIQ
jgi:hypothetical protein